METRTSAKSELALRRAHHPKLLSLQHVDASVCCSSSSSLPAAPMTPLAGCGPDAMAAAVAFSPRDPAAKLLAVKDGACAAGSPFASHRLSLPSPTGSPAPSGLADAEDEDEEDEAGASVKPNTGRWTEAEHQLFLQGLETFPYRAWKKIATLIKTRTVVQIRTHAQKYYQKLEKEEARLKERELAGPAAASPATPASPFPAEAPLSAPSTPRGEAQSSSPRRPLLRKRKCPSLPSLDGADGGLSDADELAPLPSLPKRMMREKKAAAAHMSPKHKAPGAAAARLFGDALEAARLQAMSPSKALGQLPPHQLQPPQLPHHHALPMLPLDFDEDAPTLLDLADDRALADLPFPLDGLDAMDNDDLLQLTEEELDWFSADAAPVAAGKTAAKVDDAFALGRFPFPASDEDHESLRLGDELAMAGPLSCAPSPGLGASMAAAFADEDDDFVLDPEKFLSSYLTTSQC